MRVTSRVDGTMITISEKQRDQVAHLAYGSQIARSVPARGSYADFSVDVRHALSPTQASTGTGKLKVMPVPSGN